MCFVLVRACSIGLRNAPSLLDAALFHIWHINTPDFWAKKWHWIQGSLVQKSGAEPAGLRARDAYNSYLNNHNHIGLTFKIVE